MIMSKKTTKRIQNKDDYEKSSFRDIIEDMEDTKDKALESIPKIKKEQVPSKEETTKQILYATTMMRTINKKRVCSIYFVILLVLSSSIKKQ
jgi:predicted RND superfamily exporter protein